MINIEIVLPTILYICLIILVIFAIGLIIKLMKTLDKADNILDDVNRKLIKLDGVFDLIDHTTEYATSIGDKFFAAIKSGISQLLKKRKRRDDDE